MSSQATFREVANEIVELGLADAAVLSELDPQELEESLDSFSDSESHALLLFLDYMKVRYSTDHKTFRYACENDARVYREELDRIATCGRGHLTITDVEFDTLDGVHRLRFRCNDQPHEWWIAHGPNENIDAQELFSEVGDLVPPGSLARWCTVDQGDPEVTSELFFGDPAVLNTLGSRFGLLFEPLEPINTPCSTEGASSRSRRVGVDPKHLPDIPSGHG